MGKIKVMIVFGTRPEAIKVAPVIANMRKHQDIFELFIVVTGQHREMLEQSLNGFSITPDVDLSIMTDNQTPYDVTTRTLKGLEEVFSSFIPDVLLVQGDTTTAFASALAAFYKQIPIGHIEAGLRTRNKYNPFPEEANRHLISVITDHHFAPTEKARENLLAEGIPEERIIVTGNTGIDALLMTVRDDYIFDNPLLQQIFCNGQKIILVTTHRRESFGEPMQNALSAILKIVRKYDNVEVIFPVHYNPNVRNAVNKIINSCERIHLIEPLEYESFMHVMAKSYLVLTDSGGIQEEAPSLGKPVLVLRDTSERPEGIDAGTARLVGTNTQKILDTVCGLLDNDVAYGKMAKAVNPYGDGKASERILNGLCQIYLSEERVK